MNQDSINILILRLELQKAQTNDKNLQEVYQFTIDKLKEEIEFLIALEKAGKRNGYGF